MVNVGPERLYIDGRKAPPACQQSGGVQGPAGQRSQFSHRLARAGDHDMLAGFDTVNDLTTVVAEVSNAHTPHEPKVSHVIRKKPRR